MYYVKLLEVETQKQYEFGSDDMMANLIVAFALHQGCEKYLCGHLLVEQQVVGQIHYDGYQLVAGWRTKSIIDKDNPTNPKGDTQCKKKKSNQ